MAKKNDYLDIRAIPQKDNRECGFCACSAIYRYFGISRSGLRKRLGTDERAVPPFSFPGRDRMADMMDKIFGGDSRGTLPPDICEVIWEDGLDYETTTSYEEFITSMIMNLDMGYPSIVLRTLGSPLSHWVVAAGITEEDIYIVDSLSSRPEWIPIQEFQGVFNCAIMITEHGTRRSPGMADYVSNYTSGARMGIVAAGRKWIGGVACS